MGNPGKAWEIPETAKSPGNPRHEVLVPLILAGSNYLFPIVYFQIRTLLIMNLSCRNPNITRNSFVMVYFHKHKECVSDTTLSFPKTIMSINTFISTLSYNRTLLYR